MDPSARSPSPADAPGESLDRQVLTAHILFGCGFFASTLQLPVVIAPGLAVSSGHLLATLLFGGGLAICLKYSLIARRVFRREIWIWGALIAVGVSLPLVGGMAVGGVLAGLKMALKLITLALCMVAIRTLMAWRSPLTVFQNSALVVISLNTVLWAVGYLIPVSTDHVFQTNAAHEAIGAWPRFKGLSPTPGSAGLVLFVSVCFVLPLRRQRVGQLAVTAATFMCLSTLSTFALLLPLLLLGSLFTPSRLNKVVFSAVLLGVLFLHWHQPLSLSVSGYQAFHSSPHPSWSERNLGPTHMPLEEWHVGPLRLTVMPRVYRRLTERGVSCALENPAGIGAGQFSNRCKVMTMNTLGSGSPGREPHNQYMDWLTSYGVAGMVLTLFALWATLRRYTWSPPFPEWTIGFGLIFISGLYGPSVLTIVSLVMVPLSLQLRQRHGCDIVPGQSC